MVLQCLGYTNEIQNFSDFVYFLLSGGLDIAVLIFILNWCIGFFKAGGHR